MTRPRIAFLISGLGVVERGAEVFTRQLARRLADRYDITFLSGGRVPGQWVRLRMLGRDRGPGRHAMRVPGLRTVLRGALLDPLNLEWLTASISAVPHLLRGGYDLIVPETGFWGNLVCRYVRRRLGTPFVDVGHSRFGYWEWLCALQRPDTYVALTEHSRGLAARFAGRTRTRFIPPGIDRATFSPAAPPARIPLPQPVVLCAGACERGKRIELAIRAVAGLERGSLLVLGAGSQAEALRRLGESLLPDRFMLSSVPNERMPGYYADCAVFTLPSEHEAFSIVCLEAMAANRPVVTQDDAVRRELVGDAGVLCDCADPAAYRDALRRALSKSFGDRPRRRSERYGWNRVAGEYDELFRSLLDCGPNAGPA